MMTRVRFAILVTSVLLLGVAASACLGGRSKAPSATATPNAPGPIDVIGDWVRTNRNVDFVGDCSAAKPGIDVGKICVTEAGSRGTRRAYNLGPTFSDTTALALVEQKPDGWTILSVTNRDPSAGSIPGIAWPLQVGDQVIVIGLGETECLRIREQPTQQGKQLICMPDGTKAIIQEGPVMAETFTWWRIAGDGFNGWAAGTWLRLPEAIAQALQPPASPTPGQ
ncbi:MAG: hypothetical protein M3P30_07145 [Chloroflexota bacterium]|nr:hypothetical protein [Chloroflexota bacterium]